MINRKNIYTSKKLIRIDKMIVYIRKYGNTHQKNYKVKELKAATTSIVKSDKEIHK